MNKIIEELNLDRTAQAVGLQQQWILTEVHIITLDGSDVGRSPKKDQSRPRRSAKYFCLHQRVVLFGCLRRAHRHRLEKML